MGAKMQQKNEQAKKTPGTVEKVVGYATTVSGYVDMAIEWTSRRKYEWLVIWLKEDLKIADTCKMVRENLLTLINNPDYFSPEVKARFVKEGKQDYSISPKDPAQVAVFKKLLNALTHAETGLRALEEVDLNKDNFNPTIISGVVKAAFKTIDEIYTTLQLINESGPEIQTILAPNVNALLSRMTLINGKIQEYTPSKPEARSGAILAEAVNLLPTNPRTEQENLAGLSNMIYSLPSYFEYLQNLIPTSSSDIVTKSVTSAEEYQALMIKRANEARQTFEALASKNSAFTLLPSCLSIGKALIEHSIDLMNVGAPLTKKAYLEAVGKLHEIKHSHLPQLIAELEQAEENMGLKAGVLTEPALKQMDAYYVQLATQVENLAAAANVIDMANSQLDSYLNAWYGRLVKALIGDKPPVVGEKIKPVLHLTTMQDEIFIARRKANQIRRLSEANVLITTEPEQLVAAERFFEKIGSYYTVLNYNWNLSKLSQTEKSTLLDDYKKFQTFFAARHPTLDKLIVEALEPIVDQAELTRLAKNLGISNHFTAVSACKTAILGDIEKALDQSRDAKFKATLIQGTIARSETAIYEAHEEKTTLKVAVAPFIPAILPVETGQKSSAYYHEKAMVFADQLSKLQAAKKALEDFFDEIQTNVRPDVAFHELDDHRKETLRQAYKQFQPHVLAAAENEATFTVLNARLVASLNDEQLSQTPVKADRPLAFMQANVTKNLDDLIKSSQENMTSYTAREKEALVREKEVQDEQTRKLNGTKKGLETFFRLVKKHMGQDDTFDGLNKKTQAELRDAYKKIQPQVLDVAGFRPEFDLLNQRLVTGLAEDTKGFYLAQEADTVDTVLKYNDTLFGNLAELKLSKKIDKFLTKQLTPYLKENLSPAIWNQLSSDGNTIDLTELPFKNFHQDSPEVILYKKLINSIFHLKSSLAGLENLQGQQNSLFIRIPLLGRIPFVFTAFWALVMDLVGLKGNLSAIAGNPGLQALFKENLALLQPLQNLPVVGDYVRAINEPAPVMDETPRDIVALWKDQQDLVASHIDPLSRTPEAYTRIFGENTDKTEQFFTALEDEIQGKPALLPVKEQLQILYIDIYPFLAKTHVAASFPANYISQIDTEDGLKQAVEKLQEVRGIAYSHAVNGDFGILNASILNNFAHKEIFAFYYKKVQPYLARLDSRYTPNFMETIKTPQDYNNARKNILALQDNLEKLVCAERKPTILPTRSQEAVEASNVAKREVGTLLAFQRNPAYRELFGGTNLQNIEFNRNYKKFCAVIAQAYEIWALKKRADYLERSPFEDPLMSAKEKLETIYAKLYPVLATSPMSAAFPEDFISQCDTEQELKVAIANLHEAYAMIVSQPGAYTQLRMMVGQLKAQPNFFDDKQNQKGFIALYKKLQPYLVQLDEKYNADTFVQALEQGPHFASALKELDLTTLDLLNPFRLMSAQLDTNEDYFVDLQNRQAFLVLYKQLQPELVKLDPKYNADTFVQSLEEADYSEEEAESYASALRDICNLPSLRSRLEALVITEEVLPTVPAQVQAISSVPTQQQVAAMVALEDILKKVSAKFRELKAPETAKTTAQIADEKKAKETELADINVKIKDLIAGLDVSNVDSQALQELLDTREKLTAELAQINKRQAEVADKVTKELDNQAKALVDGFRSLPFSPDLLREITLALTALEAQISRVGKDNPEQVRNSLERIRSEFGVHLKNATTQLEIAEGLEAGSLANGVIAINAQFNNYYDNLVSSIYPVSYIQLASEKLYQIADQLQKQKDLSHTLQTPEAIQQKAKSFAQQLDGLAYYDPQTVKKVLGTINQFHAQVAGIGTVSREIVMSNLKEIRSDLGRQLIVAADNAEYHLGLKPGSLATPISKRFDEFYTAFITSIATTSDQTDLALLTDTSLTDKRLTKERQRLVEVQSNQEAARVEAIIFGPPHKDADTINFYFAAINKEILNAEASGVATPLLSIKDRLQAYYTTLRPYLLEKSELAKAFPENYISSCMTEDDLREAIDNLQDVQRVVNSYPGVYDQLSELAWQVAEEEEDEPTPFADTEVGNRNRKRFLRLFEELSPYLVKISSSYWPSSFVRELQTPEDFSNALKGILALGKQLEELVDGLKDANVLKQKMAQERIDHFAAKLVEEKQAAAQRVEKFKSDTFDNYLHAEVLSKFKELGPYATIFLKRIEPDFLAKKAELLKDITMEMDIQKVIAERIEAIVPAIVEKHDDARKVYAELNSILAKENSYPRPIANIIRAEKLAQMEMVQETLAKTDPFAAPDTVVREQQELKAFLTKECNDYDDAIKVYDLLMQMSAYIICEGTNSKDDQDKLAEIDRMQKMLCSDQPEPGPTPKKRLAAVKLYITDEKSPCETIMAKNSDGIFMQLFNSLRTFLFGWKSKEQTMFDSIKVTLHHIKSTEPVPVPLLPVVQGVPDEAVQPQIVVVANADKVLIDNEALIEEDDRQENSMVLS